MVSNIIKKYIIKKLWKDKSAKLTTHGNKKIISTSNNINIILTIKYWILNCSLADE